MSISAPYRLVQRKLSVRIGLPVAVAAGVFALLMLVGERLLNDPDTYWQIKVGQGILATGGLPRVDNFSFTMTGQPWISTQWLAQIIYAATYGSFGWLGLVFLTAASIALTFALLARFLCRRLQPAPVLILLLCAFVVGAPHFLARPHTLALPVMLAWVAGLTSAAENRRAPSPFLLLLMSLWVNLHGSFVLGLALVVPITCEALWNAEAACRKKLAMQWTAFFLAGVAAACVTPYGWNSLLAAQKILSLGKALPLIDEWRPIDVLKWEGLQLCLLAALGGVLLITARFAPVRIVLFAGFFYMALSHSRNVDVFALLAPMVIAAPLAERFGRVRKTEWVVSSRSGWKVVAAATVLGAVTLGFVSTHRYSPPGFTSPAAAVAAIKDRGLSRVFNDYDFGGYLIWSGLPTFIDGRTELFGEDFVVQNDEATSLRNPESLKQMLSSYNIEATLLHQSTPAVDLLDRLDGWTRIYADDAVVVHARVDASLINSR